MHLLCQIKKKKKSEKRPRKHLNSGSLVIVLFLSGSKQTNKEKQMIIKRVFIMPQEKGNCGSCNGGGFHDSPELRGYLCLQCGAVKPSNWRDLDESAGSEITVYETDYEPWATKARKVMDALCFDSWRVANTKKDGTRYKKHRPYAIPAEVEELIDALKLSDRSKAEKEVKAIFEGLRRSNAKID
jgi:hypothetical protein